MAEKEDPQIGNSMVSGSFLNWRHLQILGLAQDLDLNQIEGFYIGKINQQWFWQSSAGMINQKIKSPKHKGNLLSSRRV